MFEYKIITVKVSSAEQEINALAESGWRVVSTAVLSGASLTTGSTPFIVTLERERKL